MQSVAIDLWHARLGGLKSHEKQAEALLDEG
jgi:hypothetical protein